MIAVFICPIAADKFVIFGAVGDIGNPIVHAREFPEIFHVVTCLAGMGIQGDSNTLGKHFKVIFTINGIYCPGATPSPP